MMTKRRKSGPARRKPPGTGNGKRCYLAFCCFWCFSFYLAGIRVIGAGDGNIGAPSSDDGISLGQY